jgi:hypothetical protein
MIKPRRSSADVKRTGEETTVRGFSAPVVLDLKACFPRDLHGRYYVLGHCTVWDESPDEPGRGKLKLFEAPERVVHTSPIPPCEATAAPEVLEDEVLAAQAEGRA